jgi:predicted TIM-barrel fold metal-dependent hydrolase
MRADIHQHIWTQPLLEALRARRALPFVRVEHEVTVLYCAHERPYVIDVAAEAPDRRQWLVREDDLDRAVIALSSPIGIEALPREAATELIEAHLVGVGELPREFAAWGPVPLDQPTPDDVDALLARGCVGISVPAGALSSFEDLERIAPMLERVAARRVPLLVHPGPAQARSGCPSSLTEPLWWPALTDYVAQMNAAWLTFAALGRREHPQLVVVFTLLAGGAPLHAERLLARGGPAVDLRDPHVFYDISSYGPVAIEAMARQVGAAQLLYGSDRPVVEPVASGWEDALKRGSAQLLAEVGAPV